MRRDSSGVVDSSFKQVQHNSGATPQQYNPGQLNAQDWAESQSQARSNTAAYSQSRAATRALEQAEQRLLKYRSSQRESDYEHRSSSRRPSQSGLGRSSSVRESSRGSITSSPAQSVYDTSRRSSNGGESSGISRSRSQSYRSSSRHRGREHCFDCNGRIQSRAPSSDSRRDADLIRWDRSSTSASRTGGRVNNRW